MKQRKEITVNSSIRGIARKSRDNAVTGGRSLYGSKSNTECIGVLRSWEYGQQSIDRMNRQSKRSHQR